MSETFSASGLCVSAGFPLPGVSAVPPDSNLPAVAFEMVTPERLEAEWSGAIAPKSWRGKLGDGEEFTIEWGRGGDLLFRYGERASFLLGSAYDRLWCAPVDPGSLAWLRVLLTRVLPNVSIANGHEALHASAVATERGVVAIMAESGGGKSTLALELVKRGWPLFADDTLVLGRSDGSVEAHPSAPFMNLSASGDVSGVGVDLGLLGDERWVAVAEAVTDPAPVAAIVLLERGPERPLLARRVSESPLALVPFMLGLPDDDGREPARFALYSDLIQGTRILRLSADLGDRPEDLAETLERVLSLGSPAPVGGIA